jgi:hypothetical protein
MSIINLFMARFTNPGYVPSNLKSPENIIEEKYIKFCLEYNIIYFGINLILKTNYYIKKMPLEIMETSKSSSL